LVVLETAPVAGDVLGRPTVAGGAGVTGAAVVTVPDRIRRAVPRERLSPQARGLDVHVARARLVGVDRLVGSTPVAAGPAGPPEEPVEERPGGALMRGLGGKRPEVGCLDEATPVVVDVAPVAAEEGSRNDLRLVDAADEQRIAGWDDRGTHTRADLQGPGARASASR